MVSQVFVKVMDAIVCSRRTAVNFLGPLRPLRKHIRKEDETVFNAGLI